jgi:hypothetical protein
MVKTVISAGYNTHTLVYYSKIDIHDHQKGETWKRFKKFLLP